MICPRLYSQKMIQPGLWQIKKHKIKKQYIVVQHLKVLWIEKISVFSNSLKCLTIPEKKKINFLDLFKITNYNIHNNLCKDCRAANSQVSGGFSRPSPISFCLFPLFLFCCVHLLFTSSSKQLNKNHLFSTQQLYKYPIQC